MEIDYNIISLIDILGFVQGLLLGVLLIVVSKSDKPTLFLGLFVVGYALELTTPIVEDLNILAYYPELDMLPFTFSWLLTPLFYVYVQKVSIFSKRNVDYKTLIPGVFFFIVEIFIFFKSPERKEEIFDSFWYEFAELLGAVYSIGILLLTLKFLKRHLIETENQYTAIEYKNLKWTKIYLYITLFYMLIYFWGLLFETSYVFDLTMSILNIVLLYWISIKGLLQRKVRRLLYETSNGFTKGASLDENEDRLEVTSEKTKELLKKLNLHVSLEEVFTKPELTIIDVADGVDVHPKRVSTIINSELGQNFNTYINKFRIEKSKELLKSEASKDFSIEGIGYEVGFQSKSAFYYAFKKVTGTTPSRYKDNSN